MTDTKRLPNRLEPAHIIHQLLPSEYPISQYRKADGTRQAEVHLIGDGNVVMYPSSDAHPSNKLLLKTNPILLAETLTQARENHADKTLYIPITEVRQNRNHFVLLTINQERTEATLWDSKTLSYSTRHIEDQVTNTFPGIHFQEKKLGSQARLDGNSCGYHVSAMISLSINGEDIEREAVEQKVRELKEKKFEETIKTAATGLEEIVEDNWILDGDGTPPQKPYLLHSLLLHSVVLLYNQAS